MGAWGAHSSQWFQVNGRDVHEETSSTRLAISARSVGLYWPNLTQLNKMCGVEKYRVCRLFCALDKKSELFKENADHTHHSRRLS